MSTVIDWYRAQAAKYGEDAADLMRNATRCRHICCGARAGEIAREAGHYGRLVLSYEHFAVAEAEAAAMTRYDMEEPEWFPNEGDRQWWRERHTVSERAQSSCPTCGEPVDEPDLLCQRCSDVLAEAAADASRTEGAS